VADNDEPGVVVTPTHKPLVVSESGLIDSYTVVLTRQPTTTVGVTASAPQPSAGQNAIALATGIAGLADNRFSIKLTFTPLNWRTPQTVYVKAQSDSAIEGVRFATITHTVSSGDTLRGSTSLTKGASTLTDNAHSFPDGLRGATVIITKGAATGQVRLIVSNTAHTLTLDRQWDASVSGDYEIRRYDGLAVVGVKVQIYDDEVAGLILTQSDDSTRVIEGGATDNYQLALTRAPAPDTTVTVTITPDDQLSVAKAKLTFTNA